MNNTLTAIPGISVGHWTDLKGITGCTVVLCPDGAVGGVDVRGSAPGTRETDLLKPGNLVQQAHAILLSGGSAYGLDAASGVMRYLEEKGSGFKMGKIVVPIVPGAILFDLSIGRSDARPGAEEGYEACIVASIDPVEEGTIGAGTGATVAKAKGPDYSMKGGLGSYAITVRGKWTLGALVAVNSVGDVVDPDTGEQIAGPRRPGGGFYKTSDLWATIEENGPDTDTPTNTTIGVVATDALLTKEQVNKLAQVAHDGLAMAVRPAHSMGDGDTFFALATGGIMDPPDMRALIAATQWVMSQAIVRAVRKATGIAGIPAVSDLNE